MILTKYIFMLLGIIFFSCAEQQEREENILNEMDKKIDIHSAHSISINNENGLNLSRNQELLAGITTDTARIKTIFLSTILTGRISIDENKVNYVSATNYGRVEKLFVKNSGERIKKGQALYELYSEQLLADENDYLNLLLQKKNFDTQNELINKLIESARHKLILWGVSEKQIRFIEESEKVSPFLTFFSNKEGVLTELMVTSGQYVNEGDPLFKITDFSSLWVEAQLYAHEQAVLRNYKNITVSFPQLPEKVLSGDIVYYNPVLEDNSKINSVRIKISNKNSEIKPGMMAYVTINHDFKENVLVVPKSAVLMEKMNIAWIRLEPGSYERSMLKLGLENKNEVEVISGIQAGDIIVIDGGYLLNSEFVLQKGGAMKHQH